MKKDYEQQIVHYLSANALLTLTDAMRLLGVSSATARRIFNRLAAANLVNRVHGGVRARPGSGNQAIPFFLREQWCSEEKEGLVRKALEFLKPDSVVFVHGGSTTLFLGKFIRQGTILTNSITLAEILYRRFPDNDGPEIIVSGGTLDPKAGILLGYKAQQFFADYRADFLITSARGMDADGLIETNDASVGMQKTMIEHAARVIVLADHYKFAMTGMCRSVGWNRVNLLITTAAEENRKTLEQIRRCGVEVIVLPEPGGRN